MPTVRKQAKTYELSNGIFTVDSHDFSAAGNTAWVFSIANPLVTVKGTGTSVTAHVERASLDDFTDAVAVEEVVGDKITGNPSTGIPPSLYTEPGAGWWRVVVEAITGNATVTITARES